MDQIIDFILWHGLDVLIVVAIVGMVYWKIKK